ncbi:hypothetical protein BU16DRAFT_378272 [Lophium mytilinum]|uniref:Uncharacterized protein n=1 Tax=Lophium mytilinum TaxID=390894 RepID=A0A6A6QW98_9PEZI|nr:hypothetical protein BU16DRAFT_378272 [Lophium mytilinum]
MTTKMPTASTQYPPRAMSNPAIPSARSYADPPSKETPPARTTSPTPLSPPGFRNRPDSPTSLCWSLHLIVAVAYPYRFPTASLIPFATSAIFIWVIFLWPYLPTHLTSPYNKHLTATNFIAASFLLALAYGLGLLLPWLGGEAKIVPEERGWPALGWYGLDTMGQLAFAGRMWWELYHGWRAPKEKMEQ